VERKLACLFAALFSASGFCQDVRVDLSLENGKTVYRSGEPIRLVLTFTRLNGNYFLDTTGGRGRPPGDDVSITPETGVDRWQDEHQGVQPFQIDSFGAADLSDKPARLFVALNHSLRIDGPGTYTVQIATRRPRPGRQGTLELSAKPLAPLTTNAVSFTVTPMTDDEERSEMQRLAAAIDALQRSLSSLDLPARQEAIQRQRRLEDELLYLTGDVSTLEKLRLFVSGRAFLRDAEYGLFMARNRELVLDTLELALRNPKCDGERQLVSDSGAAEGTRTEDRTARRSAAAPSLGTRGDSATEDGTKPYHQHQDYSPEPPRGPDTGGEDAGRNA
jgi:hypothetical protein